MVSASELGASFVLGASAVALAGFDGEIFLVESDLLVATSAGGTAGVALEEARPSARNERQLKQRKKPRAGFTVREFFIDR